MRGRVGKDRGKEMGGRVGRSGGGVRAEGKKEMKTESTRGKGDE